MLVYTESSYQITKRNLNNRKFSYGWYLTVFIYISYCSDRKIPMPFENVYEQKLHTHTLVNSHRNNCWIYNICIICFYFLPRNPNHHTNHHSYHLRHHTTVRLCSASSLLTISFSGSLSFSMRLCTIIYPYNVGSTVVTTATALAEIQSL